MTFYNEIDPYAAQWIRNLSAAGHIPGGTVDIRSITELTYEDTIHHAQAHLLRRHRGLGTRPQRSGLG